MQDDGVPALDPNATPNMCMAVPAVLTGKVMLESEEPAIGVAYHAYG